MHLSFKGLLLLLYSVSLAVMGQLSDVHYHPNFKSIPIPQTAQVTPPGIISAPIGEVTIQAPIVTVMVNGQGPFYFMFDTGFSGTLVSKDVAKAAHLPIIKTIVKRSRTPNQSLQSIQDLRLIEKVEIGPVLLTNLGVYVAPETSKEYSLLEKTNGRGIDGILGFNAFYGLTLTINYPKEIITVSQESLKAGTPYVIPIALNSSVPIIEAEIEFDKLKETHKQFFVLDTGASVYFFVNACNIPKMKDFVGKEQMTQKDYTGFQTIVSYAQLYGRIKIVDDYAVQSPYILYTDNNCKDGWLSLLGRKFFEKHEVTIDVDDKLVKIEPFQKSSPP